MKEIWVKIIPYNKKLVTTSLENGATGVIVKPGDIDKVKKLGRIKVISEEKGDLKIPDNVEFINIKSKEDEVKAAEKAQHKIVIIQAENWKVIPLENLIATGGKIFAQVSSVDEAKLMFEVLEKGVKGIVINTESPVILKNILKEVQHLDTEKYNLVEVTIKNIKPLGMSDRICIDTTTNMSKGEGMLTGNSSSCLFLVHSESIETPYVAPRPFRVNAGAVHAYIMVPGNKTRYLSELKSGDEVLIVNHKGETRRSYVGRIKLEKRPMLLIEAEYENKTYSIILQNAETIRLTSKKGEPVSVAVLKKGDKVLAYVEKQARHFGLKVDEHITEK